MTIVRHNINPKKLDPNIRLWVEIENGACDPDHVLLVVVCHAEVKN